MKLLIDFYKNTGQRKPARLIFFRNGLSEGQLPAIRKLEIPQVVQACRELGRRANEEYNPPVTSSSFDRSMTSIYRLSESLRQAPMNRVRRLTGRPKCPNDPVLLFHCSLLL